jgi:dolichol-phosphate mannosyltransferase
MTSRHVTLLMATYNEAVSMPVVLKEIAESAAVLAERNIDVSVVLADDRSPDGTADLAEELGAQLGLEVSTVSGDKEGLGAAYLRAFSALKAEPDLDLVATMDADGQHDGRSLHRLVEHLVDGGYDLVIGSRWVPGSSVPGLTPLRVLNSKAGNLAFRLITGTRGVNDATNSFRVATSDVIRRFDPSGLSVTGYSIMTSFVALTVARGFRVSEVPIEFRPRIAGESKIRLQDFIEFALNLFRIRRSVSTLRRRLRAQRAPQE